MLLPIPINGYASTQSSGEGEQPDIIENSDVLQACVTVLIGVLIFLTLERKFEKMDLTSNLLAAQSERDILDKEFSQLAKDIEKAEEELKKQKATSNEYSITLPWCDPSRIKSMEF